MQFKLIPKSELIQFNKSQKKLLSSIFHPSALLYRNVADKLTVQRPQQQHIPQSDLEDQHSLQTTSGATQQAVFPG